MKTLRLFFVLVAAATALSLSGCRQKGCTDANACNYDADNEKDDGTCINKGKITFWFMTGAGHGTTTVTLNGTTAVISVEYSGTPSCDASGCATFNACPGAHSFTATDGVSSWSGSVSASEDGCITQRLL